MNAIAIDDEIAALDVINTFAAKVPYLELKHQFIDVIEAIAYLQANRVDLLFLDIMMPDLSGIDLVKSLSYKPLIIFTTAYSEHAVSSFELDATDYLLKPFSLARFIKACNKANELHTLRKGSVQSSFIFLKTGYEQIKVPLIDIWYIEASGNYLTFVVKGISYLARMTFAEADVMLPKNMFIRVHRSFIAGLNHISRIERHQIFIEETQIPIGESYMQVLANLARRNV